MGGHGCVWWGQMYAKHLHACMAVLYICVLNLVDELSTKFAPSNGDCLPRSLRVLPMSLAVKICFGNVVISMKGVLAPG